MSKAFTRESDDSGDDEISPLRPPLPPGTTNYITREGAEHLQQRLKDLLERKERATTSSGESEIDLRKLESNIRALQQTLNSVVVAQPPPPDSDKVAFGAHVRIRQQKGEEEVYRIVGVEEAAPESGSISWLSPLARALLSRKVGDKVQFRTPAGLQDFTILAIT
jgi:transcription elongation factor GreB